jgi:hypothetical protein
MARSTRLSSTSRSTSDLDGDMPRGHDAIPRAKLDLSICRSHYESARAFANAPRPGVTRLSWWGRHAPPPSAEMNSAEPPPTRRRPSSTFRSFRCPSKPPGALEALRRTRSALSAFSRFLDSGQARPGWTRQHESMAGVGSALQFAVSATVGSSATGGQLAAAQSCGLRPRSFVARCSPSSAASSRSMAASFSARSPGSY